MNTRTIELAGALPTYNVHDRVVHTPLGTTREMVCTVSGYEDADGELAYRLLGDDQLQYKSTFRCLEPYIEADPADEYDFESHDYDAQGFSCLEDYEGFIGAYE